jgi:hypothetical protein
MIIGVRGREWPGRAGSPVGADDAVDAVQESRQHGRFRQAVLCVAHGIGPEPVHLGEAIQRIVTLVASDHEFLVAEAELEPAATRLVGALTTAPAAVGTRPPDRRARNRPTTPPTHDGLALARAIFRHSDESTAGYPVGVGRARSRPVRARLSGLG